MCTVFPLSFGKERGLRGEFMERTGELYFSFPLSQTHPLVLPLLPGKRGNDHTLPHQKGYFMN